MFMEEGDAAAAAASFIRTFEVQGGKPELKLLPFSASEQKHDRTERRRLQVDHSH